MEQFDQIEGFDQENTSQYSSYSPVKGIEDVAKNTFGFINMYNPLPSISHATTDVYGNIKNIANKTYGDIKNIAEKTYSNTKSDINNAKTNLSDFLATSSVVPHANITNSIPSNIPQNYTISKQTNTNSFIRSGLILIIILIIVYLMWKHCAENKYSL